MYPKVIRSMVLAAAVLVGLEAAGALGGWLPDAAPAACRLTAAALAGGLFLLLLRVLELRPDPLAELVERFERFRIRFLEELAGTSGSLGSDRWRRELQAHKGEVRDRLLGRRPRLSRRRLRRFEARFEAGWQQLVEVTARRVAAPAVTLDGTAIERLIDAALAPAAQRPPAATGAIAPPQPPAPSPRARVALAALPLPAPGEAAPVFDLQEFVAAVVEARRSVILEDGVYRIKQELYGDDQPGRLAAARRRSLRRLAQSAMTEERLDELAAGGRLAAARGLPVTARGTEPDRLAAGAPDTPAPAARLRVLEELRAALDAAGAALLVEDAGGYAPEVGCGMLAAAVGELRAGPGEPLYDDYLKPRRYLITPLPEPPAVARQFAFLPALLDERAAYLVFASGATAAAEPWTWEHLIARLDLQPASQPGP